jgi:hypothetical protein
MIIHTSVPIVLTLLLLSSLTIRTIAKKSHSPVKPGKRDLNVNEKDEYKYSSKLLTKKLLDPKKKARGKNLLFDTLRNKITGAQRKSYKYYLEVMARGSSEFECACIKATRPNNEPPKEKYVSSIVAAVINFDDVLADDENSPQDFNPYGVALHKLWTRVANKHDWRVKLKALYVMHRLWSSVQTECGFALRKQMKKLSKTICKKTGRAYFFIEDASRVPSCTVHHPHYALLAMYSAYVLYRCQHFSPSFEEAIIGFQLFSSSESMSTVGGGATTEESDLDYRNSSKKLISVLRKMKTLLSIISKYFLSGGNLPADDITVSCFTLLKNDFKSLYSLYEERLSNLLQLYEKHTALLKSENTAQEPISTPQIIEIEESTKIDDEFKFIRVDFCRFYIEMTEMAKQWVPFHNKKFKHFDFDKSQIQTEKSLSVSRVQDHIDSLA